MYRKRPTEAGRKVTPPSPTYMNNDQFAAYLADLRNNRVTRPGGARPLPPSSRSQTGDSPSASLSTKASDTSGHLSSSADEAHNRVHPPSTEPAAVRTSSRLSAVASITSTNRVSMTTSNVPPKPAEILPSSTYMERGQRWMEREEVGSLRQAMDVMDIKDPTPKTAGNEEDERVYIAALDEASELVWQHRYGNTQTPDPNAPYRYKPHMRKNSYQHARAASVGRSSGRTTPNMTAIDAGEATSVSRRPSAESSSSYKKGRYSMTKSPDFALDQCNDASTVPTRDSAVPGSQRPPMAKHTRRSSTKRNISGEIEQPFSGDQIWEEPEVREESAQARGHTKSESLLEGTRRNPQGRVRSVFNKPSGHVSPFKTRSTVEIYRNPPSQSNNPQYTTNTFQASTTRDDQTLKKDGVEIRSEDIRGATSMKMKDRSVKLPTPSAVSDNPERPIVSFDFNWRQPEETTDHPSGSVCAQTSTEGLHSGSSPVVIPTIVVAEAFEGVPEAAKISVSPSIVVEHAHEPASGLPDVPVIITPDDDSNDAGRHGNTKPDESMGAMLPSRPLPTPTASTGRGHVHPRRAKGHWSPSAGPMSRSKTQCHECGLAIEGRYVALAGTTERFHPGCFTCYACGTGLEALEISPEPEAARNERLDRIRRRAIGESLEEAQGKTMLEDGDERLRFYCHLDWHELFAPRCKHCKTPILGEHVVALGEHWHYGHFFCAECGDPFEQGMTHIEKDGYAWCINCQTRRTERRAPKCKMCGLAVIGQYLQALGGEWHEECFRCARCQGGFDDGQIFPKEEQGRMVVLCTGCRMAELKA